MSDRTDPGPEQFGSSAWQRARTAVRPLLDVLLFGALLGGFVTSYEPNRPDGGTVAVLGSELVVLDWLTVCAVLAAVVALGPLTVRRRRGIAVLARRLVTDRVVGGAAVVLLGVVLLGAIGPLTVARNAFNPGVQYNPPFAMSVPNYIPNGCSGPVTDGSCRGGTEFLLGTDGSGGDVFGALVHGLRTSLQVGVTAAIIAGGIGTLVGLVSGTVGGWVDTVLMRYVEVQMAIPSFFVYVLLTLILTTPGDLALIIVVFGLTSWGGLARLVRSEVLQVRGQLYVRSARAAGGSPLYRLRKHILPNVSTGVFVPLTTLVPLYVLYEAALSFLELGASENERVSLGAKIADGFGGSYPWWETWWIALFPAVAVTALTVSLLIVGDRIGDMLDPRTR